MSSASYDSVADVLYVRDVGEIAYSQPLPVDDYVIVNYAEGHRVVDVQIMDASTLPFETMRSIRELLPTPIVHAIEAWRKR